MDNEEEVSHDMHLPAECPEEKTHKNFFGESKALASLWAAVQTELLTYRRLEEGDAWISQNFNMDARNRSLNSRGGVAIALVQKDMMKPFCSCGRFPEALPACALLDDVSAYYFSNLEDWNRTTPIQSARDRWETWYC